MQHPTTQTRNISAVRAELNTLVNKVYRAETRVIVEKSGIPVAAIVSTDDLKRLVDLDRQRDERRAVLEAFRAPFRDIPADEIEREIASAIAAVRAESDAVTTDQ